MFTCLALPSRVCAPVSSRCLLACSLTAATGALPSCSGRGTWSGHVPLQPFSSPATIHTVDRLDDAVDQYNEDGYAVIRGVLQPHLIKEASEHVDFLTSKFPLVPPEHLHHHIMRNDAFWVRLVSEPALVDLATSFAPWFHNTTEPHRTTSSSHPVALFSSHWFVKPPRSGKPVRWHQDGSYWPLRPMNVLTFWLAADVSDRDNGCLRLVRKSHRSQLQELVPTAGNGTDVLGSATHTDSEINDDDVVDVVLEPGDIEVHHPNIVHGSDANVSNRRRAGLTIRYISPSTLCWDDKQPVMMMRGQPVAGVNAYRSWPPYRPGHDMPFLGAEQWNDQRRVEPFPEDEAYFARTDYKQMDEEIQREVLSFVDELGGR